MSRKSGFRRGLPVFALCLTGLGAWYASHPLAGSAPPRPEGGSGAIDEKAALAGVRAAPSADSLERRFAGRVRPFLERYCYSCHGPKKKKAGLDLSRDSTLKAVANNARRWEQVLERLHAREMPPEGAPRRPGAAERAE